jgi:23S rRNA (cytidine1920-2'-O)/16S rRNA (cytidine1409-2'-O)-methyltransferase
MSDVARMRLDEALVARGLSPSRSRARDMVRRGTVQVDGKIELRPARSVGDGQDVAASDGAAAYVSRAALKLVAALDAFGFDPGGLHALDVGASTGGFTQVLLERGASRVVAIDVGHGQFDPMLAEDPRITLREGLNARDLTIEHLGGKAAEAVVADLSFISLRVALPPALRLAAPGAWSVFLIKPQFEVGRKGVGKGGIVRDPEASRQAADAIAEWLTREQRWKVVGLIPSPIAGGSGNQEFLLGARRA